MCRGGRIRWEFDTQREWAVELYPLRSWRELSDRAERAVKVFYELPEKAGTGLWRRDFDNDR